MAGKLTNDKSMSASRLPALMGYSKYSSPNDELQYSFNAIDGLERPDIGNEAMSWGNTLEPVILAESAKRLGIKMFDTDIRQAYTHACLPLQCSLDGVGEGEGQTIVSDPAKGIYVVGQESIVLRGTGVLEAKLTKAYPEDTPDLARGMQLRVFLFAVHYETQKAITKAVLEFQSKLDKYTATGELDWYAPTTSAEVNRLFPTAHKEEIELDGKAIELAQTILDRKLVIAACESAIDDAEMKLKQMLGDAEKARAGQMIISWPMRNFKDAPEKLMPARKAYSIRQSTISIKELSA